MNEQRMNLLQSLIDKIIRIKPLLIIGGNCGCCGDWVPFAEVDPDWPWTICEKCLLEGDEEREE